MFKKFFIFLKEVLDLIYKQRCTICGCSKTGEILCKNCLKTVNKLSPYAQKIISSVQIFSAYKYENSIQKLIKNIKFNNVKSGTKAVSILLFDYYKKVLKQNNIDLNPKNAIIVPIPSHPIRSFKRGYCHMELIAKEFSKLTEIPCNFKIIKKVKNTRPQYTLKVNQRAKNIKGAFSCIKDKNSEKTIILIDDLVTTGATLGEVINELQKHNYNKIIAFTLACA